MQISGDKISAWRGLMVGLKNRRAASLFPMPGDRRTNWQFDSKTIICPKSTSNLDGILRKGRLREPADKTIYIDMLNSFGLAIMFDISALLSRNSDRKIPPAANNHAAFNPVAHHTIFIPATNILCTCTKFRCDGCSG